MSIHPSHFDVTSHRVAREAAGAEKRYGSFTSTHEAYGVLAEEVAELLMAIRLNDLKMISMEAAQVSAVALRLADQCERAIDGELPAFAERSGC